MVQFQQPDRLFRLVIQTADASVLIELKSLFTVWLSRAMAIPLPVGPAAAKISDCAAGLFPLTSSAATRLW